MSLGYHYVETDIRATRDGVAVALHDPTIDRVSGQEGEVAKMNWAQLQAVPLGDGREMPRLDEMLAAWPELRWNIDVKKREAIAPVVEAIKRANAAERVLVAAFSGQRTARVRAALGPGLATGAGRTSHRPVDVGEDRAVAGDGPRPSAAQVPVRRHGLRILDAGFVVRLPPGRCRRARLDGGRARRDGDSARPRRGRHHDRPADGTEERSLRPGASGLERGRRRLLEPVRDTAPLQVVGAYFDLHPVAGQYTYAVHAHLARVVSQHLVAVVGLYPEGGVLQGLDDGPFQQDALLFSVGVGIGVGQSAFLLVPLDPAADLRDPRGALLDAVGNDELTARPDLWPGAVRSRTTSPAGLSVLVARKRGWRRRPSAVQLPNSTSTTSSGSTQRAARVLVPGRKGDVARSARSRLRNSSASSARSKPVPTLPAYTSSPAVPITEQ